MDQSPSSVRWRVFALACGASFLLYIHRYIWNSIGPSVEEEFRFTKTEMGLLFSLFYYPYAVGQVPSGIVIDRLGAHRFLTVSIIVWSAAIAVFGQAPDVVWLGAAWLMVGAAQAGCYPALTKVTRQWFPPGNRTVLQGWIATAYGRGGAAMSPIILGTLLMGLWGLPWQTALVVLGIVGVFYGLLFGALFRNTPAEHPAVNDAERELIGTEAIPADAPAVLPARRTLRSRSMRWFVVYQFLAAGSDVAFVALIGMYFKDVHNLKILETGLLASLPLWGGALGGVAGGWLNDRLIAATGNRRWCRSGVGCVGKLIGCLMLLLAVQQTGAVAAAYALMAAKFFSDWSQPTVWGACTDLGGRYSATVFSIINTSGTLGAIVMPVVFGRLLDWYTTSVETAAEPATADWNPLFYLLAAMYMGAAFCWLMVDCTKSLEKADADG